MTTTEPTTAATTGPTGLLVVDKDAGWTSHDVVARTRSIFGQRRVGHAGTLDPDATGVLLVGLGRVTRLLRFLACMRKEYTCEIVLGVATDTLDASGRVVGEWDMSAITLDEARQAALGLTGRIEQVPPMVSAVKVGGRRLHELARQGVEVQRVPRLVCVYRFDLKESGKPGVIAAEVECSSGTYVRTLGADLGNLLGGGAHIRMLRRTRIGSFCAAEAEPLDKLGPASLRSPGEALRDYEHIVVDATVAAFVSRGRPLDRAPLGAKGTGPWAIVDTSGRLLAMYEPMGKHAMRPAVVLASR